MRIAEISVHSCPLRPLGAGDVGGMNLYILRLSEEMNKLGIEVDIFARRHNQNEAEIIRINERTRLIHIRAGQPADLPAMDVYNCLPEFEANLLAFINREGTNYDILRSHYWTSAIIAEKIKKQLNLPDVVTFHTMGKEKNRAFGNQLEPELRIISEQAIVASADRIVTSTDEGKNNLINLYSSAPEKIMVIPPGVDLEFFRPEDKQKARIALNLNDYRRILLFVGRLQPYKGLDLLLQSMANLPNLGTTLLLVVGGNSGKDDELAKMNLLAKELGIGNMVSFVGAVAHENMPNFYNAADICIVPSYHETFGMVALEALASGTPVIAARVGGLVTIVKDGETGYLFDERSPETLATYLCLLMSENEIRNSMAIAARQSAMKYNWASTARQLLQVYRSERELLLSDHQFK